MDDEVAFDQPYVPVSVVFVVVAAIATLTFFLVAMSFGGVAELQADFEKLTMNQKVLVTANGFPFLSALAGSVWLAFEPDDWRVSDVIMWTLITYLLQVVGFLYVLVWGPGR